MGWFERFCFVYTPRGERLHNCGKIIANVSVVVIVYKLCICKCIIPPPHRLGEWLISAKYAKCSDLLGEAIKLAIKAEPQETKMVILRDCVSRYNRQTKQPSGREVECRGLWTSPSAAAWSRCRHLRAYGPRLDGCGLPLCSGRPT